jgi:hypothetical protein
VARAPLGVGRTGGAEALAGSLVGQVSDSLGQQRSVWITFCGGMDGI